MEKFTKILKRVGLSETEIKIYLAGLTHSKIGVSQIVRETRIKRTTVYHALETLAQKGLAAKVETPGRLNFSMTRPENIKHLINKEIDLLKKQGEELDGIIPELDRKITEEKNGVSVAHFEGAEGVKLVVEEALYCRRRHWDIIAPPDNFFSEFDADYARYFIEKRSGKNITARSLWESTSKRRTLTEEEKKQRQPRFLPEVMRGKFKSVIIIFDDKVAIINSVKELSAILIKSTEVHNTFSALFEGLWQVSKDYGT